ncbi:MAG TPA: hypothetical protein VIJ70_01270 [Gaiellaceae bacterium]
MVVGAAAVSVIALAIVAIPALVLGYCAGRLQAPAPPPPTDAAADSMEQGDADLALACDTDAPRLLIAGDRSANGDESSGRF